MKVIKDILCNDIPYGKTEDEADSLIGTVIIEDNKLQGFATNIRKNIPYFIFGTIDDDTAEIVIDRMEELPHILYMEKDGFKYYGKSYLKSLITDCLIGDCQLTLMTPEKSDRWLSNKEEELEKAITNQKHQISNEAIELYENLIANNSSYEPKIGKR